MCLLDLGSGTFGHLACPQKGLHRNPPLCYGGALLALYSAAESRVQLTTELAPKERALRRPVSQN